MAEQAACDAGQCLDTSSDGQNEGGRSMMLGDGITVEELGNDLYLFRLSGPRMPVLTAAMIQMLKHSGMLCAPLTGVVLDVQAVTQMSIVRLASFLDKLSPLTSHVAVVFRDKTQRRLALLIHNTLVERDAVAYFTDPRAAFMFLALRV